MLINKLNIQGEEILLLLQNLDSLFIRKRPTPDKWSIQEHLAHLGRYQEIFLVRLQEILDTQAPSLKRYKAELDPGFQIWQQMDFILLMEAFKKSRQAIIDFWEQCSDDQFLRIGIHPKFGAMNMKEWLHFFLLHEGHHLYTIFRIIHGYRANL